MNFDWREFFTVAEELAERDEERDKRTAVGRAYYAAFGTARSHLESSGVTFAKGSGVHGAVWGHLSKSSDPVERQLGATGNRLRVTRNRADYDADVDRLEDVTLDALEDARAILDNFQ